MSGADRAATPAAGGVARQHIGERHASGDRRMKTSILPDSVVSSPARQERKWREVWGLASWDQVMAVGSGVRWLLLPAVWRSFRQCFVVLVVSGFAALLKSLTVDDGGRSLPSFPAGALSEWPLVATMVATRHRDYDSSAPRTRQQTSAAGVARRLLPAVTDPQRLRRTRRMSANAGPLTRQQKAAAGIARRLLPAVTDPQRLRRTWRMSTHPDVAHYGQGAASGEPADVAWQRAGTGVTMAAADAALSAQGLGASGASCAPQAASALAAASPSPTPRRKNPRPRHFSHVGEA